MAENYRPIEAIEILRAGTDKEAMIDIGRRYPLLAVNSMTEEGLLALIGAIPVHISARQLNSRLANEDGEETEVKKEDPKPAAKKEDKKPAAKKEDKKEDTWDEEDKAEEKSFEDMTKAELKAACDERGIEIKKGSTPADVIKLLKAHDKKAKAPKKDEKPAKKDEKKDDEWDI